MRLNIRSNVLTVAPYQPGKPIDEVKRELGLTHVIKLASNENPMGPSPYAVEAVKKAVEKMNQYPDGASYDLRQGIATKFDISSRQILLGNGSDELIHLLAVLFLDSPQDELMMGDPGFSRYDAAALLAPAKLMKIPLTHDWRHDLVAMADAISSKTKLVFIANPNNPTGTIVHKKEFDLFLSKLPEGVMVVMDEAYAEYTDGINDFPNALDYVKAGAPVIGLRTFSKAYGLAGIRIGYGFAASEIVDAYHRAREPFNVNSLAQVAAIAALKDDEYLAKSVKANRDGLNRLTKIFKSVGWSPYPSYANFILADCGRPSHAIFEALLREGVIVRSGQGLGMPNYLRVTVGTKEELDFFEQAMMKINVTAGVK